MMCRISEQGWLVETVIGYVSVIQHYLMNFLVKQTGLNFKSRFLSELSQSIQNQNSFDSAALTTYNTREFFV